MPLRTVPLKWKVIGVCLIVFNLWFKGELNHKPKTGVQKIGRMEVSKQIKEPWVGRRYMSKALLKIGITNVRSLQIFTCFWITVNYFSVLFVFLHNYIRRQR